MALARTGRAAGCDGATLAGCAHWHGHPVSGSMGLRGPVAVSRLARREVASLRSAARAQRASDRVDADPGSGFVHGERPVGPARSTFCRRDFAWHCRGRAGRGFVMRRACWWARIRYDRGRARIPAGPLVAQRGMGVSVSSLFRAFVLAARAPLVGRRSTECEITMLRRAGRRRGIAGHGNRCLGAGRNSRADGAAVLRKTSVG
jgi:hypothetical protein